MRVLVVDDHPIIRGGVLASLTSEFTVFEANGAGSALRCLAERRPEVAMVDLQLDGEDGIVLIRVIASRYPEVRILVLSQAHLSDVVRAMQAGAHGYVSKSASTEQLCSAVRAVVDGPVVPADLAAQLVADFQRVSSLTPRERDILRALARGFGNQEIAEDLDISIRTVNRHLESIRDKLGTRQRSDLMRIARDQDMNA